MNKMYEYLKNHAYISYNKKSTYEFELSEERAKCIANKYDNLTEELQQENKQLKDNWNKLRKWIVYNKHNENTEQHYLVVDYGTLLGKMQELEQGSDSNGIK